MTGQVRTRRSSIVELVSATIALLVITHVIFMARSIPFIETILPVIVAVLFLYSPVLILWKRKEKIDFLDGGMGAYIRSIIAFAIAAAVVFPLFLIAAHFWQLMVFKYHGFRPAGFPGFWNVLAFQLFLVALPEEFYFRGYFQSVMDKIIARRWRILGANLGWGWIITAAAFAVAHSIVYFKWWHFAIFFPALFFGYLRERTGTITAPILFHATSNLIMDWFVRSYY